MQDFLGVVVGAPLHPVGEVSLRVGGFVGLV